MAGWFRVLCPAFAAIKKVRHREGKSSNIVGFCTMRAGKPLNWPQWLVDQTFQYFGCFRQWSSAIDDAARRRYTAPQFRPMWPNQRRLQAHQDFLAVRPEDWHSKTAVIEVRVVAESNPFQIGETTLPAGG